MGSRPSPLAPTSVVPIERVLRPGKSRAARKVFPAYSFLYAAVHYLPAATNFELDSGQKKQQQKHRKKKQKKKRRQVYFKNNYIKKFNKKLEKKKKEVRQRPTGRRMEKETNEVAPTRSGVLYNRQFRSPARQGRQTVNASVVGEARQISCPPPFIQSKRLSYRLID